MTPINNYKEPSIEDKIFSSQEAPLTIRAAKDVIFDPEEIEKKLFEFYGEYVVKQLFLKLHLENESSARKIDGLFQSIIRRKESFDVIELNPLMEPYLQAESLAMIWEVLSAMSSGTLKAAIESTIFDSDVLAKAAQIREFLSQHQSELNAIKTLNLKGWSLRVLPPEIKYFSGLQSLDLSVNKLRSLPVELFQLKYIKTLNVNFNQLNEIPKEIQALSYLTSAQFRGNCLISLPEEIGKLQKLQVLNLANNLLAKLPSAMGSLSSLVYLYLESNEIEVLPDTLNGLNRLVGLYLYNNKLSSLPESISQLPYLQILSLPNNQLQYLPLNIGQLKTLQTLILDHNPLIGLPDSIGNMANLKHLSLHGCKMTQLPQEWGGLSKLIYFSFDEGLMDVFPSTISALPFWSKDPSLYPRAEMKTQGVVLNQNLHNFNEIYWKLGSKKWMECIDGVYHPHGAEVFDRGLHGKTTEPGFLKSMQNLFSFLTEHQNQKLSADFYLQCHRIACSHFKGESNGTLMGQEKIGVFRELTDTISASFAAPNYEIDNQGFSDFSDISGKLSLAFGSSFRLGDMIVVSASPLTINIVYQPMRQEQIELIFNFFLTEFYYDIGHAETEDAKLEAIAKLVQHLEWLHPPRDGCGRTDTAILNALLTTYGFTPVLLKYPYVSSCKGLKSWVKALKIGMRDWAQANSAQ